MNEIQRQYRKASWFAARIADVNTPISTFIEDLLIWLEKPVCSFEPYACMIRVALGVGKKGMGAKIKRWREIFPRIIEVLNIVDEKGSYFAQMIMNETVGHRYADYFIQSGLYESEMKLCYLKARDLAIRCDKKGICVKHRCRKNIDSSIYWLAVAYEKANMKKKSRKYYCEVAHRKGKRFKQPLHMQKIHTAMRKCRQTKK